MARPGLALLVCLVLTGCTRVIDTPQPTSEPPVAPIVAGQVDDLLSKDAKRGDDGNLFVSVEPVRCSGLAREVDPPFIFDPRPAAHDGGHWESAAGAYVYVEEIVAVYRANFDPRAALGDVRRAIDSCRDSQFTVTTMDHDVDVYRLLPQVDSGSPDIVAWSFSAAAWACDNAFVAAHNAAIEITTCAAAGGYDVMSLAKDALKRIETLANTAV